MVPPPPFLEAAGVQQASHRVLDRQPRASAQLDEFREVLSGLQQQGEQLAREEREREEEIRELERQKWQRSLVSLEDEIHSRRRMLESAEEILRSRSNEAQCELDRLDQKHVDGGLSFAASESQAVEVERLREDTARWSAEARRLRENVDRLAALASQELVKAERLRGCALARQACCMDLERLAAARQDHARVLSGKIRDLDAALGSRRKEAERAREAWMVRKIDLERALEDTRRRALDEQLAFKARKEGIALAHEREHKQLKAQFGRQTALLDRAVEDFRNQRRLEDAAVAEVPLSSCSSSLSTRAQALVLLHVTIVKATNLKQAGDAEEMSWCACEIVDASKKRLGCRTQALPEPWWNETHEIEHWVPGEDLEFTVRTGGVLGFATVSDSQFYPHGFDGELPIDGLEVAALHVNIRVVPRQEQSTILDGQPQETSVSTRSCLSPSAAGAKIAALRSTLRRQEEEGRRELQDLRAEVMHERKRAAEESFGQAWESQELAAALARLREEVSGAEESISRHRVLRQEQESTILGLEARLDASPKELGVHLEALEAAALNAPALEVRSPSDQRSLAVLSHVLRTCKDGTSSPRQAFHAELQSVCSEMRLVQEEELKRIASNCDESASVILAQVGSEQRLEAELRERMCSHEDQCSEIVLLETKKTQEQVRGVRSAHEAAQAEEASARTAALNLVRAEAEEAEFSLARLRRALLAERAEAERLHAELMAEALEQRRELVAELSAVEPSDAGYLGGVSELLAMSEDLGFADC